MTTPLCPDDQELFALLDEPEVDSAAASHVTTCAACQLKKAEIALLLGDLRAPVRAYSSDAFVAGLPSKLETQPSRDRPRRLGRAPIFLAAAVLAVAAVVLLRVGRDQDREFAARGNSVEAGTFRNVDLGLDVISRAAGRTTVVAASESVHAAPTSHLLLSYATHSARATVQLLCFAVDRRNEIHWLYPAFEDAASDPSSVALPPVTTMTPMPTEALLEDVPNGRLRVFAVLWEKPMRVSDVERLDAKSIDMTSLTARFPGADVRSWSLSVAAEESDGAR